MRFPKLLVHCLLIVLLPSCSLEWWGQTKITEKDFVEMASGSFSGIGDVAKLFPVSVKDVRERTRLAMAHAIRDLDVIINVKDGERTFENTARALDDAEDRFGIGVAGISIAKMVHPDKDLRDESHKSLMKLSAFSVDKFSTVELYNAFKSYVEGNASRENLNPEQEYFLRESMKAFRRAGLHLPKEGLERVKELRKEITELSLSFSKNIAEDKNVLHLSDQDLDGVSSNFLQSLKRDKEGRLIVRGDVPSFEEIRKHCRVAGTRRKIIKLFRNKGYPANEKILETIIAKRDELAGLLGFESFAHYDMDNQMAKNPETVNTFILDLAKRVEKKEQEIFDIVARDLPEGVRLENGKLNRWDFEYSFESYRKKHFDFDSREVAKYFTLEKTMEGLFGIYEKFLNLDFMLIKPGNLWHEDVAVIQIRKKGYDQVEGYIFLDLHPRENKYGHACHCSLVHPVKNRTGVGRVPSVALIIANFPKSTKESPSLLKHNDVTTFFHEFGHAMHGLLGRTEMVGFAGTNTKHDFVEVPSQMFEEWMWDKNVLKSVSAHYKTGQPLSDKLIDKMVELKKFSQPYVVQRQCSLSFLSSAYYGPGAKKDVKALDREIFKSYIKNVAWDPSIHFYCSFGHLTGYASKYYCYMWSKVFALDLFNAIKKQDGLLNGRVGQVLIDKVLSKGGSIEPGKMLKNFLGREPNMDAFLQDVGVLTEQDDMKEVYSFFGPPGVGKGTVAQRLVKESGYTMLSTGDLARKHISEGTDLGKTLQGYIESGGLIPDDLITQMVFEWLKDKVAQQDDPAQGSKIILDGFPRTKGQADLLLQALKEEPDFSDIKFKVVNFDLSEDEIVKRISSRLVCSNKKCQEVYSTLVKNPAKTGLCDICESPVLRRSDDEPEVVRERLRVFAGVKDDLLGFYKSVDQSVLDFKVPDGNREVVYLAFKRVLGVCN